MQQEKRLVRVRVNGVVREAQVETRRLLSDFLRHDLELTGIHVGCEHGVCGACTVIFTPPAPAPMGGEVSHAEGPVQGEHNGEGSLFTGVPIRSCLMLAVQADGGELLTVEGLAGPDGALHPLQQAFHDYHGLQCGFCTPGFLMAIYAFLQDEPEPNLSDEAIREAIAGNLCRCTGYQGIVEAVRHALAERQNWERRGR
jgi:carbon-monoxide dehydrogenase small subunit